MKQRNPSWGCPVSGSRNRSPWPSVFPSTRMWCDAFWRLGTSRHQTRRGRPGSRSWVTRRTVGGVLDLFRCESAILHTHWVLVVMDQWTRRIVGFGVHRGVVDAVALCNMFNRAVGRQRGPTSARTMIPVPIPPMAGESTNPRRGSYQDGAVRTAVATIRRTPDWHDSPRMPQPHAILDRR
jgi:hypothetical protein